MKIKLIIILALVFALSFSNVIAAEYDYPGIFIKDGKLNAAIIVGNKAPASDVIAQINIIQYFIGNGVSVSGSAKLSSETMLEQNAILIGSACNNPLTAQVLGNPSPCNREIEPGKPLIKLFKANGYFHLVVAGYTEKETRDAVNSLADHGSFEISEQAEIGEEPFLIEKEDATNLTKDMEDEKSRLIEELNSRMADKVLQEDKEDGPIADQAMAIQNTTILSLPKEEKNEPDNIIAKFINWIKLLLG